MPPIDILKNLKNRGFKNAAVVGGAQIYSLFLQNDLIDDFYYSIHPRIIGGGIDFSAGVSMDNLEIV
ncbi:hypothetical protein D6827_03245, partial [Candidatus Parcubacteria bacterium]